MKCIVKNCGKKIKNRGDGLSFHKVPSTGKPRTEWCNILGIKIPMGKEAIVCSDHFKERDFMYLARKKHLRPGAIPIYNLGNSDNLPAATRTDIQNPSKKEDESVGTPRNKECASNLKMLPSTSSTKIPPTVEECNILRGKWSKALSLELNSEQLVCERQFRKKDIKRAERFVINGTETLLPRQRWSLHKDAIPTIELDSSEEEDKLDRNENSLLEELCHTESPSQGDLGKDDQDENVQLKEIRLVKPLPNTSTVNNILLEPSLEEIHAYFRSIWIPEWCYFAIDNELVFAHFNVLTRKEDMRFSIAKDLSLKVSFSQRPEFPVDVTITSIDDIKVCMENLQTTILCQGTGIQQGEFASNCTGQVSSNEYARKQQHLRCSWCRNLRRKHMRNIGRKFSKFNVKKSQVIEKNRKRYRQLLPKLI